MNIPATWSKAALRHLTLSIKDGTHGTFQRVEQGVPLLSAKNVTDSGLVIGDDESLISDADARAINKNGHLAPGDILLTIVGTIGRSTIYESGAEVAFQRSVAMVRPRDILRNRYLVRYFQSAAFLGELQARTKQSAQGGVYLGDVAAIEIPIPPMRAQDAIVSFIDRKTAAIDALVGKKERLIELLQEKRRALLTQAVTKGLDPSVPMKETGVPWLDSIPTHWDLKRLKFLTPKVTVGIVVTPAKYYVDAGVPCPRSFNVKPGRIDDRDLAFISEESNRLLSKSIVRAGDLLAVRTGQPGTTAVVPAWLDGGNCVDLIIVRRSPRFNSDFLCQFMNSSLAHHQYGEGSEGALQQHFNVETASNLLVPTPPVEEQARISSWLTSALDRADRLLGSVQRHIDKLREYRQALITAAVTGQIDVSTEAA